jgi:hypothetical protein
MKNEELHGCFNMKEEEKMGESKRLSIYVG